MITSGDGVRSGIVKIQLVIAIGGLVVGGNSPDWAASLNMPK